ncbi:MAG: NADH-quinone oxidoreductase subunit L [Eubacterium sp.]|nr:NADH-quinone oxidoreductase subunit L [Eubacterium sp.]MBQ6363887.1 NADH-quinone oxidoreductase subunit L [Lachnospiraceae bacterium]
MGVTVFLILFPLLVAPVMYLVKNNLLRGRIAYVAAGIEMAAVFVLIGQWARNGFKPMEFFVRTRGADHFILDAEILLMIFVTFMCFKYRKYWISLLSIVPTLLIMWFEFFGPESVEYAHIRVDYLSVLMCLIIGIVGGFIIVYAVGYMHGYHHHHVNIEDRRPYFFMILFLFIGAMFGFVLSASLLWIDFFWEITSVCSFLLISYTKEEIAIHNAFRALWLNLLGGVALAVGIVGFGLTYGSTSLYDLIEQGVAGNPAAVIPVALIAFAALTKAAQFPFSSWLLGAMVAPTPSSALLHSATMVKAGIYILFRLAPAMEGNLTGNMIAFIGGFTFFVASILAISQHDGKGVLALSTISNLGLMTACAGVGRQETIWAGIFLMMFHSVSKSLLFQDVGATENTIGSRDIENMHGLLYRLPMLASFMIIGIAGMFLAPFGMLIAKWSALKASIDENNMLLILFIAFGSATTGFYWSKWLGKLIARSHETGLRAHDKTKRNEQISLCVHAVLMVGLCVLLPFISIRFVDPLVAEMFGSYEQVLSQGLLITMVAIIALIFLIPIGAYLISNRQATNVKLSYMSGANVGNNSEFVDSFGGNKKLWLSNYYFADIIHFDETMRYCTVGSAAVIVVMLLLVIGGVLR